MNMITTIRRAFEKASLTYSLTHSLTFLVRRKFQIFFFWRVGGAEGKKRRKKGKNGKTGSKKPPSHWKKKGIGINLLFDLMYISYIFLLQTLPHIGAFFKHSIPDFPFK